MAEWGTQGGGQAFESAGAVAASSAGTTVAASASANTKGAWVEITAATARDAQALLVELSAVGAMAGLVDVAVGASGSEVVIVANLIIQRRQTAGLSVLFPIPIPAGTRLALRLQSTVGSASITAKVLLVAQGIVSPPPLGLVTTYGAATADSGGTTVDPGGTANTDSAWTELSSGVNPCRWLLLSFTEVSALFGLSIAATWLVDVAVGAGGSEVELVADLLISGNPEGDMFYPSPLLLPLTLPAGARLSVRARCTNTDASDRRLDVIAYGIA